MLNHASLRLRLSLRAPTSRCQVSFLEAPASWEQVDALFFVPPPPRLIVPIPREAPPPSAERLSPSSVRGR